ncbi:hypothetical protein [Halarcobacter sp.]|uniref:hypothetical protein n=1 Tax=Halarcobacter sp. TaxID=2321133 RepID=UPI003AFF8E0D
MSKIFKITFTDKETFQSWEKDDNRIMYLKELSSDDFDISFKIENGKKALDSIEIKADNVSLEKIAKYMDYTKEELKEFNHLESDTLNKDSNLQIPVSKKEIEGGHGKINQYTTQDGEYVFIVPNGDSSTSTYATFTDGFNQKGA